MCIRDRYQRRVRGCTVSVIMVLFLLLIPVVLAAVVFFLLNHKVPLLTPEEVARFNNQSFEVQGEPKEGESLPRRRALYPELVIVDDNAYSRFKAAAEKHAKKPCMGYRSVVKVHKEKRTINGQQKDWEFFELSPYKWMTYEEVYQKINNFASGLRALGFKAKDNLGLYEETRYEWSVAAFAAYSQSIVVLTVYANLGLDALVYAVNQGELRYLLTNGKMLKSVLDLKAKTPNLEGVIYTDSADPEVLKQFEAQGLKAFSFDAVVALGEKSPVEPVLPAADDLAVIMYTSGSTGNPKGVMITHKNITSTVQSGRDSVDANFTPDDVYISYLPLAHILALVVETLILTLGASVGYGNPRSLVDSEVKNCKGDLRELQPTVMAGVPSVYDKVKKGVMDKISHSPPAVQAIFRYAFEQKKKALLQLSDTPFLNKLLFNKIKDQVGGRVRLLLSGGAPLSKDTHEFLRVAICPFTIQGYGLTETTGGSTLMYWKDVQSLQRCGPPLSVAEIKLVDVKELNYTSKDKPFPRGEVWVRGGNISKGYYKLEQQTKEAYFEGGWFATGDIGQFDERGVLQIIDRKKNIVKLSHGEYIAVEFLESIYKNSPYVENVCIIARSTESYLCAVVLPSKKNLARMANKDSVDADFLHLKSTRDQVHSSIIEACKKAKLKTVELPKYVYVVDDEWTPENLMLTAAMKIKRSEIEKKYAKQIDAMYVTGHD
eukprot:TRINITY_DN1713_c0_g1_i1.p1 TRINITY_DN1713_c0_g1~~TRINITY_DN1713_c0_g1_i1.p1  ORF type:complete len:716 (+),score=215.26 TRINITY_DN1713_c0_g1_i1:1-2148(+)